MERPLEAFWSVDQLNLGTVYRFDVSPRFQLIGFKSLRRLIPCHSADEAPDSFYNVAHPSPIKSVVP